MISIKFHTISNQDIKLGYTFKKRDLQDHKKVDLCAMDLKLSPIKWGIMLSSWLFHLLLVCIPFSMWSFSSPIVHLYWTPILQSCTNRGRWSILMYIVTRPWQLDHHEAWLTKNQIKKQLPHLISGDYCFSKEINWSKWISPNQAMTFSFWIGQLPRGITLRL